MIDVRLVDPEKLPTPTSTPETSEDESDDPDDPGMTEIRYVPDNSAKLQDMFKAMSTCQVSLNDRLLASQCKIIYDDIQITIFFLFYYNFDIIQELHPDPEDENDPDEQIEDYGENEDEGAFEDADEDDPDGGGDNGHNGEEPMES